MIKNIMRYFSLLHLTSNKGYKGIIESKKINKSVHNIEKGKIQWLGDGIYFWDINDLYARKLGINLIKGRSPFVKITGIKIDFEINSSKIIDLDNDTWAQEYIDFLKKICPDKYEKILDYKKIIQEQSKVGSLESNKLGELTGSTLNLFVDYLKETKGKNIDLIIGYFHHNTNKNSRYIFAREKKDIAQYCIKNDELVNSCMDNWKFIHNI